LWKEICILKQTKMSNKHFEWNWKQVGCCSCRRWYVEWVRLCCFVFCLHVIGHALEWCKYGWTWSELGSFLDFVVFWQNIAFSYHKRTTKQMFSSSWKSRHFSSIHVSNCGYVPIIRVCEGCFVSRSEWIVLPYLWVMLERLDAVWMIPDVAM
jgi:hypothetical protein